MSAWSVTLPGQPSSGNELEIHRAFRDGRVSYSRIAKSKKATAYGDSIINVIRAARPSRWAVEGYLRITYRFFLVRDMDTDNVKKIINDSIKKALQIDDQWFLTTDECKHVGVAKNDARVEITIDTAIPCHHEEP